MATAKKLPSGSWRVQVYSHKDNGKKVYESFTAPTKAEAEMKAAKYAMQKKLRARYDLTVKDALEGYINAKEGVLSPGTIRGYDRMRTNNYEPINNKRVRSLTSEDLQLFVSDLAKEKSPKTVKNVYALLTASLGLYAPDMTFKVTLPAKQAKRPVSPSDEDVQALYKAAQPAFKVCIGFGMCGLREGEISALKYEDIENGVAYIHSVMVKDKNNNWIYKDHPKTEGSVRSVTLPKFLLDLIGDGEGYVTNMNPATISKKFTVLRDKLGSTIRFHDLRHYFASSAAILGIPDIYTADMGGWDRNSSVMKSVYQNNIKSMSDYYSQKMNEHLNKVIEGSV